MHKVTAPLPPHDAATGNWYAEARYGLFIHYGLYSLLGRGEWVMNREAIPPATYRRLQRSFTAERFDADALCRLAVAAGMTYINFTTMHHEGFALYDSRLNRFNSRRAPAGRDLTAEIVAAARRHGLKIALYHSLNNWTARPDAVAALESKRARRDFIKATHERLEELVRRFNPIDTLWYDGWWPFNADGWQAEEMNARLRAIQPHLLFNGRNGLPGDFGTPEGHLSAPRPWRPWEACMPLNNSWGYHAGDHEWKSPAQVVDLLATVAQGQGSLLLNVGPRAAGDLPPAAVRILRRVGAWLRTHREAIFGTDRFTFDLRERGDHRGDWCHHGPMTIHGDSLFLLVRRWPGRELTLSGLRGGVERVALMGAAGEQPLRFRQQRDRLVVSGLPEQAPDPVCPVLRFRCDGPPAVYLCGGLRVPRAPHPHYDPCPSDLLAGS